MMPATWLTALAWFALATAFISAGEIVYDLYGRRYRQRMTVMEAVWPLTGLFFGPVAVWAYRRFGRRRARAGSLNTTATKPRQGQSHRRCQPLRCRLHPRRYRLRVRDLRVGRDPGRRDPVCRVPRRLRPRRATRLDLPVPRYVPMRDLNFRMGIVAAAKADILSLSAFEVGLFGWMAYEFVFFPAPRWSTSATPAATKSRASPGR